VGVWQKFVDAGGVDVPDDLWDDALQALKQVKGWERLKYASPKSPSPSCSARGLFDLLDRDA
jgi:hypothetical protein